MAALVAWLANLPVGQSGFLVIVVPTVVAMALTLLVRGLVGLGRLEPNNEVAGFKYAVLGVTYAVLLGFAVVVVWENFRDGEAAVMSEASSLSTIYRLAGGADPEAAVLIRQAATRYGEVVLTEEAPMMARGRASPEATKALTALYASVLTAKPETLQQSDVYQHLLGAAVTLSGARRDRVELIGSTVPLVVWVVLFGGAILNIVFTLFFGTRHIWVQMLMSGMVTAVIFMALFAIIMIDHPFAGSVRVSLEPIQYVLEAVGGQM